METKSDLRAEIRRLGNSLTELRAVSPLKTFEVRTSDGDDIEIKGHGFAYHGELNKNRTATIWVYPDFENVAEFLNPVYVREFNQPERKEDDKEIL